MTPREKFITLIKNDILRLGDARLDFGNHIESLRNELKALW